MHIEWKGYQKNKGISIAHESIWFSTIFDNSCGKDELKAAYRLHKKGLQTWSNLWAADKKEWKSWEQIRTEFKLAWHDKHVIEERLNKWDAETKRKLFYPSKMFFEDYGWLKDKQWLPVPSLVDNYFCWHHKPNGKWKCSDSTRTWKRRLKICWEGESSKHITLTWSIVQSRLWIGERAAKLGISDGLCSVCHKEI